MKAMAVSIIIPCCSTAQLGRLQRRDMHTRLAGFYLGGRQLLLMTSYAPIQHAAVSHGLDLAPATSRDVNSQLMSTRETD